MELTKLRMAAVVVKTKTMLGDELSAGFSVMMTERDPPEVEDT